MNKQINFIEKEQDWSNETTRYWFEVDKDYYCIADQNGELTLLDSEGYPIEEQNDHDKIKQALLPHYEQCLAD